MLFLAIFQSASGALHNKHVKWAFTGEIAGLLVNMNNSFMKILVCNPVDWLTWVMDTVHSCKNNKARPWAWICRNGTRG